jgi:hypothetical protein
MNTKEDVDKNPPAEAKPNSPSLDAMADKPTFKVFFRTDKSAKNRRDVEAALTQRFGPPPAGLMPPAKPVAKDTIVVDASDAAEAPQAGQASSETSFWFGLLSLVDDRPRVISNILRSTQVENYGQYCNHHNHEAGKIIALALVRKALASGTQTSQEKVMDFLLCCLAVESLEDSFWQWVQKNDVGSSPLKNELPEDLVRFSSMLPESVHSMLDTFEPCLSSPSNDMGEDMFLSLCLAILATDSLTNAYISLSARFKVPDGINLWKKNLFTGLNALCSIFTLSQKTFDQEAGLLKLLGGASGSLPSPHPHPKRPPAPFRWRDVD